MFQNIRYFFDTPSRTIGIGTGESTADGGPSGLSLGTQAQLSQRAGGKATQGHCEEVKIKYEVG